MRPPGSVDPISKTCYMVYRQFPFIWEFQAILDWTATETSLDLFQWFKLEDAYSCLYFVKYDMECRKAKKGK